LGTVKLDASGLDCVVEAYITHPDGSHRTYICENIHIHFETRIRETEVDPLLVVDKPPALFGLGYVRKLELDDNASGGELPRVNAPVNVPHQKAWVEFVTFELAAHPALTPYTKRFYQGAKLLACRR
jgi:hypothetical protein